MERCLTARSQREFSNRSTQVVCVWRPSERCGKKDCKAPRLAVYYGFESDVAARCGSFSPQVPHRGRPESLRIPQTGVATDLRGSRRAKARRIGSGVGAVPLDDTSSQSSGVAIKDYEQPVLVCERAPLSVHVTSQSCLDGLTGLRTRCQRDTDDSAHLTIATMPSGWMKSGGCVTITTDLTSPWQVWPEEFAASSGQTSLAE